MARSFNDLKKEKTIAELNRFCREVAIDYATSANMESREKRAERFDIFPECYRTACKWAVTHYLVSDHMVEKMQEVARFNQMRHTTYGKGKSSVKYYSRLREERKRDSVETMKDFERNLLSSSEFISIHGITQQSFFDIVKEALTQQAPFSFDSVKEIELRLLRECSSEEKFIKLIEFFGEIWRERKS